MKKVVSNDGNNLNDDEYLGTLITEYNEIINEVPVRIFSLVMYFFIIGFMTICTVSGGLYFKIFYYFIYVGLLTTAIVDLIVLIKNFKLSKSLKLQIDSIKKRK